VALACTYYDDEWKASWRGFIEACGFDVVYAATMANQGLVQTDDPFHDYGWSIAPELTRACVVKSAEDAPDAEAIVVTGAGNRTVGVLPELEALTGKAIVAADTAPYWAAARVAGLPLVPGMLGRLGEV
jgi:maleate isomerase